MLWRYRILPFICDALRDLEPLLQFKKVKKTNGGVILLVNMQALACNVT